MTFHPEQLDLQINPLPLSPVDPEQGDPDSIRAQELLEQFRAEVDVEGLIGQGLLPTADEARGRELAQEFRDEVRTGAQQIRQRREEPIKAMGNALQMFGQDAKTIMGRVLKDLGENFAEKNELFERLAAGESMALLSKAALDRVDQADTKSALDIIRDSFQSSTVSAATFGMNLLPWVGPILTTKLEPIQAALEERVQESIVSNIVALETAGGQFLGAQLPMFLGVGGGVITGSIPAFGPFMAFGRVMARALFAGRGALGGQMGLNVATTGGRMSLGNKTFLQAMKATSPGIIGDVAGFGLFGIATGERGLIAAIEPGASGNEQMGERFLEVNLPDDAPWWMKGYADTHNRLLAGASSAGEGFLILTSFNTLGALVKMGRTRRAVEKSLHNELIGNSKLSAADVEAMVSAQNATDPGLRRYARIRNVDEANAVVELAAADDIITNSVGAIKLMAEQQGIEGIVSYQTSVAALAKGVHELSTGHGASTVVLRNIEDPYRMYQRLLQRSETGTVVGVKQEPQLLVHAIEEVPDQAFFGFISGHVDSQTSLSGRMAVNATDRNPMPIHLQSRPNSAAVDLTAVEEVIVQPTKVKFYDTWNHLVEDIGTPTDKGYAALRKNGTDAVVIKAGAGFEQEVIILDPSIIRSSKPVLPEHLTVQPRTEQSAAEVMARELANEPIEIALSKRLPDFIFEAPVRRENGKYDVVFRQRGAPGMSNAQRKQFSNTGYFQGQNVVYGGTQWEVVGRTKGGLGERIKLHNSTTNTNTTVAINNVQELPHGNIAMPVDDAVYGEFVTYFDDKLLTLHKNQISENTIRDIARNSDVPAGEMLRDYHVGRADVLVNGDVLMPSSQAVALLEPRFMALQQEVAMLSQTVMTEGQRTPELLQTLQGKMQELTQLQKTLQHEMSMVPSAAARGIDLETAFIQFPDPLDHFNIIWKRFMQDQGITGPVGETEALKHAVIRRLNQDMFTQMPKDIQTRFLQMQDDLLKAMDTMPNTLENSVRMAGFHLLKPKGGGFILQRPGSIRYEGIYETEEAVRAAVNNSLRNGGAPSTTPQTNWMTLGLPAGGGEGATFARDMPTDVYFGNMPSDGIDYLAGSKEIAEGRFFESKPAWAVRAEELTGFPIWENVQPMFKGMAIAANQAKNFEERLVRAAQGMTATQREEIGNFVASIESHTVFRNHAEVQDLARQAGLTTKQIGFLTTHREVMDELFGLGFDWFGFTPQDYLYQYMTHIRPINMAEGSIGNAGRQKYPGLPKDMDVFVSKYNRRGSMLPNRELDPLTIDLKYVRSFFSERHVAPHWERLRSMADVTFGELPEATQKAIRARQPAGAAAIDPSKPAMPESLFRPLNELLISVHGYAREQDELLVRLIQTVMTPLGVKMPTKVVKNMIGSMQSWHYGATLAGRGRPVMRNGIQAWGNLYMRLDARSLSQATSIVSNPKTLEEAMKKGIREGIIDVSSLGVLFGENVAKQILEEMPIEIVKGSVRTPIGWLARGLVRQVLLDGGVARGARQLTEVGMLGIKNTDHFTRLVAAEAQEIYIRPFVERFLNGRIDETMLRRKGLKYWDAPIKDKFMRIMQEDVQGGSEKAITYLRSEASAISNFLYHRAAQPASAQTSGGRVAYQYGVYGINYKDLMFRTMRGAETKGEMIEATAKQAMVMGAIGLAGMQLNIDMASWLSFNSVLGFGGGPAIALYSDIRDFNIAPYGRKAQAFKDLVRKDFMRTSVPGMLFIEDVKQSFEARDDPQKALLMFLLGRDNEDKRSWALDMLEDGGFDPGLFPSVDAQ